MCQRVLIAMAFASKSEARDRRRANHRARRHHPGAHHAADRRDAGARWHRVMFITHDLRLAAQVCDDILVLYAGRTAEYGPARRVFANPAHPYTRCLQLANPSMSGPRRGLYALPERMPGLRALTSHRGLPVRAALSEHGRRLHARAAGIRRGRAGPRRRLHPRSETTARIAAPALASGDLAEHGAPLMDVNGLSKTFRTDHGFFRRSLTRRRDECRALRCTRTSSSASSAKAAAARAHSRACWSAWSDPAPAR